MAEVGRNFCRWKEPIWSNYPVQVGADKCSCPGPHMMSFQYLQGQTLHFSGQHMPVLSHLHCKKSFLMFRRYLLCFSLCSLLLVLLLTTRQEPGPDLIAPSVSAALMRTLLCLLWAEQTQLSLERCSRLLMLFVVLWGTLSSTEEPREGHSIQLCFTIAD